MALSVPQQTVADDPNRFKVLITGRRFGKTFLGIRELCKAAAKVPGSINWVICPSYRMAKQIWWTQLKAKLTELRWIESSNEAELQIVLKNKSVIALKGADNPDSLRGLGLSFVVFDEFQDTPKEAFTEVIRPALSDKKGRALFTGTPKGIGSWSHELFTRALNEKDWSAFQFTTIQGGNVDAEEIEAAKRDLDWKTFQQEYCATFTTWSGVVSYNFDYKTHVKKLQDPEISVIHCGIDFNILPITACIAQIKGDQVHVFDEIRMEGSNTDELAEEIKNRYPYAKVVAYPDPASRQKKTSAGGRTDFSILMNAGFNVKARQSHTPVRDRVNGLNAKLKTAAGGVSLYIDPKCKFTIDSLQRLSYKEGTSIIDKDSGLDHQFDALTYMTDYLFPIKTRIETVEEPLRWGVATKRL